MLKILQARLQQYVNHELLDVQAGFRKGQRIQRSNCQRPYMYVCVYIYIYIYIFFFIVVHHRTLNTVPCATQEDLAYPFYVWWFASAVSKLPVLPSSIPHLGNPSLLYVCESVFHRYAHLCHILESTYKWYHMVLVSFWLSLLGVKICRSSHVAPNSITHSSHTKLFQYPVCNS